MCACNKEKEELAAFEELNAKIFTVFGESIIVRRKESVVRRRMMKIQTQLENASVCIERSTF